jgi:hypothetical protein
VPRHSSRALIQLADEIAEATQRVVDATIASGRRKTIKRLEGQTIASLYQEINVILSRLQSDLATVASVQQVFTDPARTSHGTPVDTVDMHLYSEAIAAATVVVKSLYHWAFIVLDTLRSSRVDVDTLALERLAIFRSKLVVHYRESELHRARDLMTASSFGPAVDSFQIFMHPLFSPSVDLRRLSKELRRLDPWIPELAIESNIWERVNLAYRNWCRINDRSARDWARNQVFPRTGLRSDPPTVIAEVLLTALLRYRRAARF